MVDCSHFGSPIGYAHNAERNTSIIKALTSFIEYQTFNNNYKLSSRSTSDSNTKYSASHCKSERVRHIPKPLISASSYTVNDMEQKSF